MKLNYKEIEQIIEKAKTENRKEIIFGTDVEVIERGYGGLIYVFAFLDKNTIEFTTDVPDYISEELENRLEKLFGNFGIYKFEISIHHHKGDFHDKNIRFSLENSEDLPKVIKYILRNFYKSQDFDYCFK
jgi:hypothetical protein